MSFTAPALLAAAAGVGFGHAVLPDHWVPLSVIARTQRYPLRRVLRLSGLAGLAHVGFSLLLGAIIIGVGLQFRSTVERHENLIVGGVLLATGAVFLVLELLGRGHGHSHDENGGHSHAHGRGHSHNHHHGHGHDNEKAHDHATRAAAEPLTVATSAALQHSHDHEHAHAGGHTHDHSHDHGRTHNHGHDDDGEQVHTHGHSHDGDHDHAPEHAAATLAVATSTPARHTHDHDHGHDAGRTGAGAHTHSHTNDAIANAPEYADNRSRTARFLAFAVPFGAAASPDLTILPVFLAASAAGLAAALGTLLVFSLVTVGTIVGLTMLGTLAGYQLRGAWIDKGANLITAGVLLIIGILVAFGII
ncbi:nickel/cobalt exporter [Nocardia sp. GAS34]|uniref:hypothetical protein n=1 Tax=unclassified Nocardia TaxID=2637762 RepID=UPI003D2332E4